MAKPIRSLTVLKYQRDAQIELARRVARLDADIEAGIAEAEGLLRSLGRPLQTRRPRRLEHSNFRAAPRQWHAIVADAEMSVREPVTFADLLTRAEISERLAWLTCIREEFDSAHKLDATDMAIAVGAGTLAALVDAFLVVMPSSPGMLGKPGTSGGALSDFFRQRLQRMFSQDQIAELARRYRVPFDAVHSSQLDTPVPGLSARTHRFHALGHDPLLGFVIGALDIKQGMMTTLDSEGRLRRQATGPRSGMSIFQAVAHQLGHLSSDVGTPAGLPAPLMPLLQLLGTGRTGNTRSLGDLPRLMYSRGYNFGHFLALSVPTAIVEVVVRGAYFVKCRAEGQCISAAMPFQPLVAGHRSKLNTMLVTAHLIAASANGARVAITQNPLAFNYVEWLALARSGLDEMFWLASGKRSARNKHFQVQLDARWEELRTTLASW